MARDEWPPHDSVCAICGAVGHSANEIWQCETCGRWVCWRHKVAIFPPRDAKVWRIKVQCDDCGQEGGGDGA